MRRIGPAAAVLGLLALTACGGGDGDDPNVSPAPTTTTAAPLATGSSTSSPTASAAPGWPAGCASPAPLHAGATVVTATVAGGKVTTDKRTYDVKVGSDVRIEVTADVADEVHVHGYDIHADTQPGCPAVIDLKASIPGGVEVELEKAHKHLFELRAR